MNRSTDKALTLPANYRYPSTLGQHSRSLRLPPTLGDGLITEAHLISQLLLGQPLFPAQVINQLAYFAQIHVVHLPEDILTLHAVHGNKRSVDKPSIPPPRLHLPAENAAPCSAHPKTAPLDSQSYRR